MSVPDSAGQRPAPGTTVYPASEEPPGNDGAPGRRTEGDRTVAGESVHIFPQSTHGAAHLARHRWARQLIDRAPGAPAYGSPEWLALPDGPAKVAAVVRAAECWAAEGDQIEVLLRAEIEMLAAAHKQADDADYVARRDAHREAWRHLRPAPTPGRPRDLYDIGRDYMRGEAS